MKISRRTMNVIDEALSLAFDNCKVCQIHKNLFDPQPAVYGVSWCAKGLQDVKTARDFANEAMLAAMIAETLTELELEVDSEKESSITNANQFYDTRDALVRYITKHNNAAIKLLISELR